MASASGLLKTKKSTTILIILAVVLIAVGAGSYLYLQNEVNRQNANTTNTNSPSGSSTEDPIEEKPGEQPVDNNYLILEDWGVKFSIPNSLRDTEVIYIKRISNDEPPREYYIFTIKQIQELEGKCEEQPFGDTITLGRHIEKPYEVPHGELINVNLPF